jgi:DNA-3-methyladenine glycosylase I
MDPRRCGWVGDHPLYVEYHDTEWGVPAFDDARQFEFLVLEGMQAGLSWMTILKKRENFHRAFAGFDVEKIARFTQRRVEKLLGDAGIIRNRQKIEAAIGNAKAFLKVQAEFHGFNDYIWGFVDGRPVVNAWKRVADIPSETERSRTLSKDLKQRGFRFVGPTTIYAHMQATGMVNDHLVSCFRYREVQVHQHT